MSVSARFTIVWAFPSPTVKFVFHSIQEMLTSNNSIHWHEITALSWVSIHINLLVFTIFLLKCSLSKLLSILEKSCQECIFGLLVLLILLLGKLPLLDTSSTSLFLAVHDLCLYTLNITIIAKKQD
jgi:hypothetical protein